MSDIYRLSRIVKINNVHLMQHETHKDYNTSPLSWKMRQHVMKYSYIKCFILKNTRNFRNNEIKKGVYPFFPQQITPCIEVN